MLVYPVRPERPSRGNKSPKPIFDLVNLLNRSFILHEGFSQQLTAKRVAAGQANKFVFPQFFVLIRSDKKASLVWY